MSKNKYKNGTPGLAEGFHNNRRYKYYNYKYYMYKKKN